MTHAKKAITRTLLAFVLAIALPASAFAAEATVTESLTIDSTISITGIPSSISYGNGLSGHRFEVTPSISAWVEGPDIVVTVTGNNPDGLTLSMTATDMTRTGGGGTIPASARFVSVTGDPGSSITYNGTFYDGGYDQPSQDRSVNASYGTAGVSQVLATTSGAVTDKVLGVDLSIDVAGGTPPGDYTGSVTFAAIDN